MHENFIEYIIKIDDIYKDIEKYIEKIFQIMNYTDQKKKVKKVTGLMKSELGEKNHGKIYWSNSKSI